MIERLQPAECFPIAGISAASRGGGLLFVSGQVPLDPSGRLVGSGDFRAQAEQVFANLSVILADAGSGFERVLKLTAYFTDIERDLPDYRVVRDRHVPPGQAPASTAVQVSRLFRPDVWLEVEAIALA